MTNFRKFCVFILLAVLTSVCFQEGTAQENWCDFFTFRNEFEIESDAKVDAYIKRKDYAKAAARAKKLDFDSRALASIYAYAGKKDEAFRLFLDAVREEESEEVREFMFLEDVVLLRSVSFNLADEFYAYANEQRVITVPKEELLCKELQILMLFDQMADSEKILNSLLDSSYAGEDLIDVTISFLWKIESEKEKVRTLSKTLLAKFPDSLDVKLNWIGSLASAEPQQAILELARFKKQFPDFYWDEEKSTEIQHVRENILEVIRGDNRLEAEIEKFFPETDSSPKDKLFAKKFYELNSDPDVKKFMAKIKDYDDEKKALNAIKKAEKKSKFDPRVLATMYFYFDEDDEAFRIYSDYLRGVPEENQKEEFWAAVWFFGSARSELGEEFYSYALDRQAIKLPENKRFYVEIDALLLVNRREEAEPKLNLLLDASCAKEDREDLILVTLAFIARVSQDDEKVKALSDKLLAKFPDDPQVKLQWIDSLVPFEPKQALEELELLTESAPDFCEENQLQIRLIRGFAYEALGQDDRAKETFDTLDDAYVDSELYGGKVNYDDIFKFAVHPDVRACLDKGDFAGAEEKARELNPDPRVLGVICARAGKMDEAYRIFVDFIREAPEEDQTMAAFFALGLLRDLSQDVADEFYSYLLERQIITVTEKDALWEIGYLSKSGRTSEAEARIDALLDSSSMEENIVNATVFLLRIMKSGSRFEKEKAGVIADKLHAKFPDSPRATAQWIDSLLAVDPKRALSELDLLETSDYPEFHQLSLQFSRGEIYEALGERELAKAEFEALLDTDLDFSARLKLEEYGLAEDSDDVDLDDVF